MVRGRSWWFGWHGAAEAVVTVLVVVVMLPDQVSSLRWIVGSNNGWTFNVDYDIWIQDKHFYLGDWLFFVYDRDKMNVLEVNKTDYETCNSNHPLHNWTTGAGRDVVHLNVTKDYYFISDKIKGKGLCNNGMKVKIHVENPTVPEKSPTESPASHRDRVGDTTEPPSSSPLKSPSGLPFPHRDRVRDEARSPSFYFSPRKSPSGSPVPVERPESQKSGSSTLLLGRIFIASIFALGVLLDLFLVAW